MKVIYLFLYTILTIVLNSSCGTSNPQKMNTNPLLCDPKTGICEMPNKEKQENTTASIDANKQVKKVKIIYYTDPICSSCWGIEPQLRKLKLAYGNYFEIEYRMGGLLPDWSYNSGGISKPSDVAHHWDEVSKYYDMPIDGDVWLENPLNSSYPPSIAFKAAELQDQEKAIVFLRIIREMVFLQKKNITDWQHLEQAAQMAKLDTKQFKIDYEGRAKTSFEEDIALGKKLGVRGFPTMFFTNTDGVQNLVYGSRPYEDYENALLKLDPKATKSNYDKSWQALFEHYSTLTLNEFASLSQGNRKECELLLNKLSEQGVLNKYNTKNGALYSLKQTNL